MRLDLSKRVTIAKAHTLNSYRCFLEFTFVNETIKGTFRLPRILVPEFSEFSEFYALRLHQM
jgi:hypothetical protein